MKASWDFPRSIASTRILVGLGRDHGLGPAQCLVGTGIRAGQLELAGVLVEPGQEFQVIRNLLHRLGDDQPLALEAAARYHPTTFGIWGFAIMSSPTVGKAVELAQRYLQLTSAFCTPRFEQTAGEAVMIADDEELPEDLRHFLVERDMGIVLSLQRDVLPMRLPLTRLEFRRSAPPYAKNIASLFGRPARFDQPRNCAGMGSAVFGLKLPQGDYSAMRQSEAECQKLMETRRARAGMAGNVRNRLMLSAREMPTMETLAHTLDINARTLRRRLADEGTDYETLIDEVRATLAEELLKTTDLTIEDIAGRLGYSEPSCFTRAFKRWNGIAPRRYRRVSSSASSS